MKPVKTKDWGANFAALSAHLAARHAATVNHSLELQREIANHQGHAYGRHGYQADWISQLVRVVTSITPDQPFAPTGVEAVIREWNVRWIGSDSGAFSQIVNAYDATGNPVTVAANAGYVPAAHAYTTAAGLESGGFLSPELQKRALEKALLLAQPHLNVTEAEYPGINHPWKVVTRCMVVVDAGTSAGFGLGYKRTASFTPRTREQVLTLVDALQTGKTRRQVGLPDTGASLVASNGQALRPEGDRPAFASVGDLLDHLGVEAFWQKTALVVLQKAANGGAWTRVTMYPCNLSGEGWAPANKIPGKPWSGRIKRGPAGTLGTLPVPIWRPA